MKSHKLKDLRKENADLLEADPGKCEDLTMSVWASWKSLPEVRTGIPALAAKRTPAPELQKALTLEMIQSRYPKSSWTHVFIDGSAENAVRNGGSGAYIRCSDETTSLSIPGGDLSSDYRSEVHALKAATELLTEEDCNQQNIVALQKMLLGMEAVVPTSVAQMEQPPPSPSQLVTWAPTTEQKCMPWKLPQNSWLRKTATSRILSCCLTPCLLFSLWQMAPLTFASSSYTTACILCQTTTE